MKLLDAQNKLRIGQIIKVGGPSRDQQDFEKRILKQGLELNVKILSLRFHIRYEELVVEWSDGYRGGMSLEYIDEDFLNDVLDKQLEEKIKQVLEDSKEDRKYDESFFNEEVAIQKLKELFYKLQK